MSSYLMCHSALRVRMRKGVQNAPCLVLGQRRTWAQPCTRGPRMDLFRVSMFHLKWSMRKGPKMSEGSNLLIEWCHMLRSRCGQIGQEHI